MELDTCPFCGDVEIRIRSIDGDSIVMCGRCGARTRPTTTQREAIDAWQRRDGSCGKWPFLTWDETGDLLISFGGDEAWVVTEDAEKWIAETRAERTCREATIDKFFRGCSECGYMWEYMYGIGSRTRPNYCPNCGAKVVS